MRRLTATLAAVVLSAAAVAPAGAVNGTAAAQRQLQRLGLDPGPVDGIAGAWTNSSMCAALRVSHQLNVAPIAPRAGDANWLRSLPDPLPAWMPTGTLTVDRACGFGYLHLAGRLEVFRLNVGRPGHETPLGTWSTWGRTTAANCPTGELNPANGLPAAYIRDGRCWVDSSAYPAGDGGNMADPIWFGSTGAAIHGSRTPVSPTSPGTHGCVRVPLEVLDRFGAKILRVQVIGESSA